MLVLRIEYFICPNPTVLILSPSFAVLVSLPLSLSGSSSQNGSALRRELSSSSYSSKRQTMTSPSESSLSSGGGMDAGDAQLSQFDREVSNVPILVVSKNISMGGKISLHHSFCRCQQHNRCNKVLLFCYSDELESYSSRFEG